MPELQLPFKPFTFDEVKQITEVGANVLDSWVKLLPVKQGNGATGLEWMAMFGVYCGWRYLQEGAPKGRAEAVMCYVASITEHFMLTEFNEGRTFPVPRKVVDGGPLGQGCLVLSPGGRLGNALNLRVLFEAFKARVETIFPRSK